MSAAPQATGMGAVPDSPPLKLPHSGVTWSQQLDGDTLVRPGLASQPDSSKTTYKARESVSMYLEDGSRTMQVVEALREK